ncbi:AAA family ATPase [Brachybacterium sp. GU-2]|uniref:AAA family ATPase n=1 Tax=Brachybacterium sp. GU-2 TaxID=3069708 RepID=UPI00280C3BCB|nr:AAA family ATPase [Brachybacterium sp. GU-2]WME22853.1 AAA family ATPase [Brachybacterium sp. GU-2]
MELRVDMLESFQRISGIGLFRDATGGRNLPLKRVTLIYGENARGKSTLAATLGSAQNNDPTIVTDRATIDTDSGQHVSITRSDGTRLSFKDGAWSGNNNNIRVFDSEFIENNVHSGHEITSDHRKNLLAFALGEKAVEAEARERRATSSHKEISAQLELAVQELLTETDGMAEPEFTALTLVEGIDEKIKAAEASVENAISRRSIMNQSLPAPPDTEDLDLDYIFDLLNKTLESAHASASRLVLDHFSSRSNHSFEDWVSAGQPYDDSETCPYCGQVVEDRSLLDAYKLHFNKAYRDLKADIEGAINDVESATSPTVMENFAAAINSAREATTIWEECGVAVHSPGVANQKEMTKDLSAVRTNLLELLNRKQSDLDWKGFDSEVEGETRRTWERFGAAVRAEAHVIGQTLTAITDFKRTLEASDVDVERRNLRRLRLSKLRHSEVIAAKVERISSLRKGRDRADTERRTAREDLKKQMNHTLSTFGEDINKYLAMQFASFRIDRLSSNFMGGSPRTNYGILLREREVGLTGVSKSFRTALSESDKRTMAFAFFLASTLSDSRLHERIVVVDDPMSSLDRNRRSTTVKLLQELAPKCAQLIVIAHDPQFLLDLDSGLERAKVVDSSGKKSPIERAHLKLVQKVLDPTLEPYTDFAECDLARECESKYARNYRTVSDFVTNPVGDGYAAATAIRPLLEGFLHRRYPKLLPENCMFGKAVSAIENATHPSPLVSAQHLVPDLRRVAYFGNDSHHDTSPDAIWAGLSTVEIRGFAAEALSIVHGER